MSDVLNMYVVFGRGTKDFPGVFVCRRNEIGSGTVTATQDCFTGNSLEDVRQQIPPNLQRLDRHPHDDPNILEVWF